MRVKPHTWLVLSLVLFSSSLRAEYLYSKEYTEASQAILAQRYSDARTLAESMLAEDPASFEAHAVLGQAHLWGEEDLGLAQQHFQKAQAQVEGRFTDLASKDAPRRLHQQVLNGLRQVAFLREDYPGSLAILDRYETLYEPRPGPRAWLLLKLGRFNEAEAVVVAAQTGLMEYDPAAPSLWDTLGQIAYEQSDLATATEMYERAATVEIETAPEPDPVYLTNLGEALRDGGDFAQAEERFEEALDWPHPGSYAEPNKRLAYLYAGAGRFEEAFSRLESAISWRAELRPQVVAHTRASHLAGVSEVFLAFGDARRARLAIERSLLFPYRLAMNSGSTDVLLAKRYLLYAGALGLEAEQIQEALSTADGAQRWKLRSKAWAARLTAAWARSQATVVLATKPGLEKALRPYGAGAMQCPWLLSELAKALGQPVIDKVLADATAPAWLDYAERLQEPSFAAWETLVKAQMLARKRRWAEALKLDPSVTRRLGLSIGVTVVGSAQVENLLDSSPRFHRGKALTLTVESGFSARLIDGEGNELAQIAPQEGAERLVEALHRALFERDIAWSASRRDRLLDEPDPGRVVGDRLYRWLESQ